MIRSNITYEHLEDYEDKENTSVVIKKEDGNCKWVYIWGLYQQWKVLREGPSNSTKGIKRQVRQPKIHDENIKKNVQ